MNSESRSRLHWFIPDCHWDLYPSLTLIPGLRLLIEQTLLAAVHYGLRFTVVLYWRCHWLTGYGRAGGLFYGFKRDFVLAEQHRKLGQLGLYLDFISGVCRHRANPGKTARLSGAASN